MSDGDFIFTDKKGEVVSPDAWTKLVQRVYKRYADVSLAPKDLRSCYVTFLKSGDHGDEILRATAVKMRHSSKMQSSAAYDKSNKLAQTAVATCSEYSAKFKA